MTNKATQRTFDDVDATVQSTESHVDATLELEQKSTDGKGRANELDGRTWGKYSVSIWSDIRKSKEEIALGHPAIFPLALVTRLINMFTSHRDRTVLDPFVGVGSTVVAAQRLGKNGIGFELSARFAEQARNRCLSNMPLDTTQGAGLIINDNALNVGQHVDKGSVDFVITSPPYWDILTEKRSADGKEIRNYGNEEFDLGTIADYKQFLRQLELVFSEVYDVMRSGVYCCVVVMDLRKKDKFFPFHTDVANFMQSIGFIFDDIIIWDRRHEYNNFRPLGYPWVFRVNKAHEFILIFKKPNASRSM